MEQQQYLKNLTPPQGLVDVVLDTDAYTEIDDLYAIGYMLKHPEKFRVKGICAAPFWKPSRSNSPKDGMEKSYEEVKFLLTLTKQEKLMGSVYRGSEQFMDDEATPVSSAAAAFMADLAGQYSPEAPLYIVAIGAITNVASAILQNPAMKENCVVLWLGGNAQHIPNGVDEYNMRQDIAAARVVFSCGVPLVHLPCKGVVDRFVTTKYELEYWLKGKNPLCDYLYNRTVADAESYAKGRPWSRVIWDVTPLAWLFNSHGRFMQDSLVPSPIPGYDKKYTQSPERHLICSVHWVNRDVLFEDLFRVLADNEIL